MERSILDILVGISALVIGFILFFMQRKAPETKKFVESMTILLVIFSFVALTFPFLTEFPGYVYYFLPIYLTGAVGWLFFTQYVIIENNNWWQTNWEDKITRNILQVFFYLIGGFFVLAIILVAVLIPMNPNWIAP